MRKFFLILVLSVAFAATAKAGVTPIAGFAGCENGLYYPDTGQCVVGLAQQPNSEGKQYPVFSDTSLIGAILHFRDMIF